MVEKMEGVEVVEFFAEIEDVQVVLESETNEVKVLWNLQRDARFGRSGSGRGIRGEGEVSRGTARSGECLDKERRDGEVGRFLWRGSRAFRHKGRFVL